MFADFFYEHALICRTQFLACLSNINLPYVASFLKSTESFKTLLVMLEYSVPKYS
jgi:hypothetical protein